MVSSVSESLSGISEGEVETAAGAVAVRDAGGGTVRVEAGVSSRVLRDLESNVNFVGDCVKLLSESRLYWLIRTAGPADFESKPTCILSDLRRAPA